MTITCRKEKHISWLNHAFLIISVTTIALFFFVSPLQIHAQSSAGPQPPPVEIEFTSDNPSPLPGDEITLHLKVTPLKDMHADIKCLLPEGVGPVRKPGLMSRIFKDRHLFLFAIQTSPQYQSLSSEAVGLWVGPIAAGETKEFIFRVTILDKGSFEFIAVVKALEKWGIKEETLVIDIK